MEPCREHDLLLKSHRFFPQTREYGANNYKDLLAEHLRTSYPASNLFIYDIASINRRADSNLD